MSAINEQRDQQVEGAVGKLLDEKIAEQSKEIETLEALLDGLQAKGSKQQMKESNLIVKQILRDVMAAEFEISGFIHDEVQRCCQDKPKLFG